MAVGTTSVKLTERGKVAALTLKEYRSRRNASSEDGTPVEEPWYARYTDEHVDAMASIAREIHSK